MMYNIRYDNRQITSQFGHLVDIGKPFATKIDRMVRKSSLENLRVSPDETRHCPQIKRFVVPLSSRFAYNMHVTYKDDIKCQAIYEVKHIQSKPLLFRAFNYITHNVNRFKDLENNLLTVIKLLSLSWPFDGIVTDIPWLTEEKIGLPVLAADWSLTSYENETLLGKAMNMVLSQFKEIPLNTLTYDQMLSVSPNQTNIGDIPYKCPLIIMKSNSTYAGWLANRLDRGLPVVLFKLSRIE